jgi:hypothetical protein
MMGWRISRLDMAGGIQGTTRTLPSMGRQAGEAPHLGRFDDYFQYGNYCIESAHCDAASIG